MNKTSLSSVKLNVYGPWCARLKHHEVSLILISHKIKVMKIADRITVLKDGGSLGTKQTANQRLMTWSIHGGAELKFKYSDVRKYQQQHRATPMRNAGVGVKELTLKTCPKYIFPTLRRDRRVFGLVGAGRTKSCMAISAQNHLARRPDLCRSRKHHRNPTPYSALKQASASFLRIAREEGINRYL